MSKSEREKEDPCICDPVVYDYAKGIKLVTIIGIDPGSSSGAIAAISPSGVRMAMNMPDTYLEIYRQLKSMAEDPVSYPNPVAYVEDVGGTRPGNSAKSARTFAEHCGALEMALLAAGIPQVKVLPRKWMVGLFGHSYPTGMENLGARKAYIYEKMQQRWPSLAFTKRQADAVGIATWGFGQ